MRMHDRTLGVFGQHSWARHVQRQLVEVSFFVPRGSVQSGLVSYHAMQLFEADMAAGTSYITNNRTQNHMWGTTE
jgi:hypothetical protein